MREAAFLKKNRARWREFEDLLKNKNNKDPDRLADLFVQVMDDLSYAQTFYPGSRTRTYLNRLAAQVYLAVYSNKQERKGRLKAFFLQDVPQVVALQWRAFVIAALVLLLSVCLGVMGVLHNPHFIAYILGPGYVEMTLENIRNGDPTGVYKDADAVYMFFRIAFNNLRIDVLAFVSGIFLGWGTLSVVFTNGVMLGAFFMLFYQHNVHADAWRIILIHGTIEILTIIISAAAGLTLGGGILFPGTYKRLTAFRMGATRGLKIMLGVLPFTIIAAILESFVTRYSDMNLALNLFIIIGSLALMIGYFFVYPIMLHRQGKIAVEVEE